MMAENAKISVGIRPRGIETPSSAAAHEQHYVRGSPDAFIAWTYNLLESFQSKPIRLCRQGRLSSRGRPSDSLEVLLDFAPRQAQHDRPPMRADARIGGPAQFLEDVAHLVER